eukprot:scaffold105625_cov19-Tisochrysis_lutea.AAC.2
METCLQVCVYLHDEEIPSSRPWLQVKRQPLAIEGKIASSSCTLRADQKQIKTLPADIPNKPCPSAEAHTTLTSIFAKCLPAINVLGAPIHLLFPADPPSRLTFPHCHSKVNQQATLLCHHFHLADVLASFKAHLQQVLSMLHAHA